jgi:hypothetical protein
MKTKTQADYLKDQIESKIWKIVKLEKEIEQLRELHLKELTKQI